MRISKWKNFKLLSLGQGQKIEEYDRYLLMRPDPLAQGNLNRNLVIDACFKDKQWTFNRELPNEIILQYRDMFFITRPTSFKHTGIFPEQGSNWDFIRQAIRSYGKPVRILNLFAYTGGASIAAAMEENTEEVVHVDSLKSLNNWAKENARLNHLEDKNIRYIQDDVIKFLEREIRRGRTYHGIIMDPPSFGRGPKGEVWEIQKFLAKLLELVAQVLDKDACFLVINTYTQKIPTHAIFKQIKDAFPFKTGFDTDALALQVHHKNEFLSCGQTVRWCYDEDIL